VEIYFARLGGIMQEVGPQHPIHYRQEILSRFFGYVKSSESFYVIGAASIGKTRLLDFLSFAEVQKHYLGENADRHWLVRVDLNRLAVKNETWAFYELLLSSILLDLNNHENIGNLSAEIAKLDSEVIQKRDLLLALRFFELAVNRLCQAYDIKLCFLLDEFDEVYRTLPRETFSQLRAVRDANKYRVSFVLFLRDLPENLRPSLDNESFYELLSRNWIGLGPYTKQDALHIIQQLEERRNFRLTPEQREKLFQSSGGHPGIIQALLSILIDMPNSSQKLESPGWMEWLGRQPVVIEECRKIYNGISKGEQEGLVAFATGNFDKVSLPVEKLLFTKQLLQNNGNHAQFFSKIFEQYIRSLR
jgi:hypothetical protein